MAIKEYQTKQGTRYKIEAMVRGKRIHIRGFKRKKDAEKQEKIEKDKATLEAAQDGQYQIPPQEGQRQQTTGTTSGRLVNEYLDFVQSRFQSNTYTYKHDVCSRFFKELGPDYSLIDLEDAFIEAHLKARLNQAGPKAANSDLKELKALFNWGIKHNLLNSNPFRIVEKFPEEQFIRTVPKEDEVAALRLAAEHEERAILDLLYYTAARLSELCRLTWRDVDFQAETIRLWTRKRKGGTLSPRVLAMAPPLVELLTKRFKAHTGSIPHVFHNEQGFPLHKNSHGLKYLFARLYERITLPGLFAETSFPQFMAADQNIVHFLACLYYLQARLAEAAALRWDALAKDEITLKRYDRNRHTFTSLDVPIPDALRQILISHPKTDSPYIFPAPKGLKYDQYGALPQASLKTLCQQQGYAGITAHSIRHFTATKIKNMGKKTRQIQNFLGHQRQSTTEIYLHEMDVDRNILDVFNEDEPNAKTNPKIKTIK